MAAEITPELLAEVVGLVPPEWIGDDRSRYVDYLLARIAGRAAWLPGAAR